MKYFYLNLLGLLLIGTPISAQLLLEENFNYSDATLPSPWTSVNTGSDFTLASTSLSYSNYASSGIGKSVAITASDGKDAYRTFTGVSAGSVYVTFLLQVSSATSIGDYFFTLSNLTGGSFAFRGRVFARSSGTGFQVGIAKSTDAPAYATEVFAFNTTVLLTVKYTFVTGSANDSVDLFINPSTTNPVEGAPTVSGADSEPDFPTSQSIASVFLRQNDAGANEKTPNALVDGIRVSAVYETSLPVELTYFRANALPTRQVQLNWATASERNSDYFLVERSVDLQQFISVARFKAAGESYQSRTYAHLDDALTDGTYYYRLVQVDRDGTRRRYRPAAVRVGEGATPFVVYPNPSSGGVIFVRGDLKPIASVELLTLSGTDIPLTRNYEDGLMLVPNQVLPKGVYLIRIQRANGISTLR